MAISGSRNHSYKQFFFLCGREVFHMLLNKMLPTLERLVFTLERLDVISDVLKSLYRLYIGDLPIGSYLYCMLYESRKVLWVQYT